MKICTILGTRPEIIKLSPLLPLLDQEFEHILIHTGQHYDYSMDEVFFQELHLPLPNYFLKIGSHYPGKQTALILEKVEAILLHEKPDLVIVQGDTNTAPAGSLAAVKLHLPVMHIEAGCRSFNRNMPEETNRIIADHLATYLIAPDEQSVRNLKQEGLTKNTFLVGSTSFDAAVRNKELVNINSVLTKHSLSQDNFVLVTIHRAENTDNPLNFQNIMSALNQLSLETTLVFPLHPRTKKALLENNLSLSPTIKVLEPQSYLDFLALLSSCKFCLSDSGGIQEEAVVFNKPCLIPRNETEWMRLVEAGKNFLLSTDTEKIVSKVKELLHSPQKLDQIKACPYTYDIGASVKIMEIIRSLNLKSKNNRSIMIHPTADVSSQAQLGQNVKIWHQAQVREGAVIGDNCIIAKNVYIDKDVKLGLNCKIQNNSSIYHGTTLENGVFIGPHCVFTNDQHPRAINVDGTLKQDADWKEEKTVVKEGASLGARVVVLPGITIGRFAMVGAGSIVTKDVPDFALVYGCPAKLQGYVCKCGNKLEEGKKAGERCDDCSSNFKREEIKSIIFDFGRVILHDPDTEIMIKDMAVSCGVPFPKALDVVNDLIPPFQRGELNEENFWQKFTFQTGAILPTNYRELWVREYSPRCRIDNNIISLVMQLKLNEYKVMLMSNIIPPHATINKEKGYFSYFDSIILSFEVRARKPELKIYQTALARYNLQPKEAIYIDDILEYVQAARSIGLKGIHYQDLIQLKKELLQLGVKL